MDESESIETEVLSNCLSITMGTAVERLCNNVRTCEELESIGARSESRIRALADGAQESV